MTTSKLVSRIASGPYFVKILVPPMVYGPYGSRVQAQAFRELLCSEVDFLFCSESSAQSWILNLRVDAANSR